MDAGVIVVAKTQTLNEALQKLSSENNAPKVTINHVWTVTQTLLAKAVALEQDVRERHTGSMHQGYTEVNASEAATKHNAKCRSNNPIHVAPQERLAGQKSTRACDRTCEFTLHPITGGKNS